MEVDYIIVGQGIAGTILADHLLSSNHSVLVYDEPTLSNSSKVAGGLYNPITGRKMVKTWLADQLFPYLTGYYTDLQERLGVKFLNETPIYRPFLSVEELNEWMGKSAEPAYEPFVREVKGESAYGQHIKDDFGGLLLAQSGYVDTARMVKAYREYLLAKGALIEQRFDTNQLQIEQGRVRYEGHEASRVIFCDGPVISNNSYFDWLPLNPVKGELLYVKVTEEFRAIYNRGVFIIPIGEGICKVGATYDHHNLDTTTTQRAKNQLLEKLSELIRVPYEVIDQVAGVRPATRDRRPFIGIHPEYQELAVFGGLGTKGVSLAPYFARQFVEHMTKRTELHEEVNIQRFFSLY